MSSACASGRNALAGLGQQGALWRAVEQADAEPILQALDLTAQRRLSQVQLGGGPAEVQVLGHDGEVPDQS